MRTVRLPPFCSGLPSPPSPPTAWRDDDRDVPGGCPGSVRGGDGDPVTAAAASGRVAGDYGGPVPVIGKGQAAGQRPGLGQSRRRISRGPDGQVQRSADPGPDGLELSDGRDPGHGQGERLGGGPFLLLAVRVSGYTPAAVLTGVPEMVAVPSLLSENLTPAGSRPVLVILGAGSPVLVTVNVNAAPNAAVAAEPLVKAGP